MNERRHTERAHEETARTRERGLVREEMRDGDGLEAKRRLFMLIAFRHPLLINKRITPLARFVGHGTN